MAANEDENDDGFASFFKEEEELKLLLAADVFFKISDDAENDAKEKICEILERYQEQPELLDPHLEHTVTSLMALVYERMKDPKSDEKADKMSINRIFSVIYILCKVRGYKTITRFFPHEVADLEPTLLLLQRQTMNDYETWETRYGLFLWLSMIVLIPFDLKSIDSSLASNHAIEGSDSLVSTLISLGKQHLAEPSTTRDAAGVMLSRLFSRPDMDQTHLSEFFDWATAQAISTKPKPSSHFKNGIFYCLFEIIRHAPRESLEDKIQLVFERLVKDNSWTKSRSGLVRKLTIKLAQRVALCSLKPQVCKWRYQRGTRSLLSNLDSAGVDTKDASNKGGSLGNSGPGVSSALVGGADNDEEEKESDDEDDIPERVDEVIQHLLDGLRDTDTVVRWSAAKGIGRITWRLPPDFGDEVVEGVLELFSDGELDGAWHGGCLALAELARRGLLLPARLESVVPLCLKALLYDVRTGSHSVGAHVRDAASYLCWAFARAYEPEVLAPYVKALAQALLTVAVFDREVNCRRAASAAFQENVGRQGNFPHGIAINTAADYMALGNRKNAYTNVSIFVASHQEYQQHLIDHLYQRKIIHWDQQVRELACEALACMISLDDGAAYIHSTVLSNVLKSCIARDLCERHGCCLAVAKIISAIHNKGVSLDSTHITEILQIIGKLKAKRFFSGSGTTLMRVVACQIIQAIAECKLPCTHEQIDELQKIIDDNLNHPTEEIQGAAQKTLRVFTSSYYVGKATGTTDIGKQLVERYTRSIFDGDNMATRGATLALGVLPLSLVLESHGGDDDDDDSKQAVAVAVAQEGAGGGDGGGDSGCNDAVGDSEQNETLPPADRRSSVTGFPSLSTASHMVDEKTKDKQAMRKENAKFRHKHDNDSDSDERLSCVVNSLILSSDCTVTKDPETRRNAMSSLAELCCRLGSGVKRIIPGPYIDAKAADEVKANSTKNNPKKTGRSGAHEQGAFNFPSRCGKDKWMVCDKVIKALLKGMTDYATDRRGDVGSWIRTAAMESLKQVVCLLARLELLTPTIVTKVMNALAKQMVEKINRMRELSGKIFYELLVMKEPQIPHIPHRTELLTILPEEKMATFNWGSTKFFPFSRNLLTLSTYRSSLMSGLVLSVGGLTESIVTESMDCLLDFMDGAAEEFEEGKEDIVEEVGKVFIQMCQTYKGHSRVIIPLYKTLDLLLAHGSFDHLTVDDSTFGPELLAQVTREALNSKQIKKINASISVFLGLLSLGEEMVQKVLNVYVKLITFEYPTVRRMAADEMYARLVIVDCIAEDKLEEVMELISNTVWDGPMKNLEEPARKLVSLLGIKESLEGIDFGDSGSGDTKQKMDYGALVKQMGY